MPESPTPERIRAKLKLAEDFFSKHDNDTSFYDFVRIREKELYENLANKKRIYLDVNFWIQLRNTKLGRTSETHKQTLRKLQELVEQGVAICPITDAVFMELLKQSDSSTRRATAEIIDELSRGVIIKSFFERQIEEFHHFMEKILQERLTPELPAIASIWANTPYILGHFEIQADVTSKEKDTTNKAFYDFFRTLEMIDIIEMIEQSKPPASSPNEKRFDDLARDLSASKKSIPAGKPLKELYNNEMAAAVTGIVGDLFTKRMIPLLRNRFPEYKGEIPSEVVLDLVQKTVFNGFRAKQAWMAKRLPTLHIHCMLHANMNRDVTRNFKANDFFDFKHACAALPYCDLFATENPLTVMIKNLKLDTFYSTTTVSNVTDLLEALNSCEPAIPPRPSHP